MTVPSDLNVGPILMVGTAPPTRCGLASYTNNLGNAMQKHNADIEILRVLNEEESRDGEPPAVRLHWRRNHREDLRLAARYSEGFDAMLLQHEFGIYPGDDGIGVLDFLDYTSLPTVSVLHTVLAEPSTQQRIIIDAIIERSETVVVHSATARERLVEVHEVPVSTVRVIPHGASSKIGLTGPLGTTTPTLLTWGLLGLGKGIEYGIMAIAELRGEGIDIEYVISGATHPNVLKDSGDSYRHSLRALSRQLGVDDLVRFDQHYRSKEEQEQLIREASVVLLPYDTREQVTSGVLVEAIAAGKPTIATAFPHAIELAERGAIALVDHQSSDGIAEAVKNILLDPKTYEEMRAAAWIEGLRHDWSVVGPRFLEVLHNASSRDESDRSQFKSLQEVVNA